MSDGLFSPLPIRRESEIGRLLLALEVPDCSCRMTPVCMAGEQDYPANCPGQECCKKCPTPPCPCVRETTHSLTLAEWHELLHAYDAEGYSEPPPPAEPAVAMTSEAQLAVMIARAHAGTGLRHPEDVFGRAEDAFDHLAVAGLKRLRQGDVLATYHEGESDEEVSERENLNREVDPGDKIAMRSLEFDRAAARAAEALRRKGKS